MALVSRLDEKTGQIILMERPENFAKSLRGLGKELWKGTDANTFIKEERSSW